MVKKMFQIVYKEVRGLHQAAYVLGVFAFGSQLLALVRDRLLAHQFGAGYELDLYYAAFRIPDLLYVLFASTLSVYVLIPFVASSIHEGDATEARKLLSRICSKSSRPRQRPGSSPIWPRVGIKPKIEQNL